ncbi:MAG: hypothetical protein WHT08_03755 [Bryobacteraceae bacterium]
MIVAMPVMRVVEMIADEVVDVIPVRHGRVPAAMAVHVAGVVAATAVRRRADRGIASGDFDRTLIDVVFMHGVQAAVVEIVDVIAVANGSMAAAFAVDMRVLRVDAVVRHGQTLVISKTEAEGYNVFEETFSLTGRFSFACTGWIAARRCRCCARA